MRRFRFPWRSRAQLARELDAELTFHLESRADALVADGVPREEALRRAREEFGDIERTRAYCRDVDERAERETRTADRITEWRQDVKYAFRTLRRSPGFAFVSLLTLALAIGANTAIFSVARAVLLEPLPYGSPDALTRVFENYPGNPTETTPLSPPDFVDYKAQQRAFSGIAAIAGMGNVTWRPEHGDPESVTAAAIATDLLTVLQVKPLHGRNLSSDADQPGHDPEVLLSYGFWQRAFGGDLAVVGKRVTMNGQATTIVGVMPSNFTIGWGEEVWMPLDLSDDLARSTVTRRQHWVHAIGRLRPGVTLDAATADLAVIGRRLAIAYPQADSGRFALVRPVRDTMIGSLRPAVLLLQGAAAMVLLIACANLANLTLSRTIGRRREMALRAALGAGRGRLTRQLLTESLLLAVIGGAAGVVLATVATRALLALNPDALPAMFTVSVDSRVMLFSLALSAATGVLFGLLPALDAARADVHDSLKDGGRGSSGRAGERVKRALVIAQVGLALMLLVGAGLLVRSFRELTRVRIGFDPDHVLTAQLRAGGSAYDSASAVNKFYDGVIGEIAQSPGVEAVGGVTILPTLGYVGTNLRIEGQPTDESNLPDLGYIAIRGGYLRAMRIPVVAGREFDATDVANGPLSVMINETAARRFFPKGNPVGHRIRIGPNPNGKWMTIVGVVGDVRAEGLDIAPKPMLVAYHREEAWDRSLALVVRTIGDPMMAAAVVRRAVKNADPAMAIRDIRTLNDIVGASLARRRFSLGLASCFAVVALLLAAVGIYGVLAYMVTTRTREFGVRMALGASARSVLVLVVRQGMGWSLAGILIGVCASLAAGRVLDRMLYGVTSLDPSTYIAVVAVLLAVVAAACVVPAARATRVDPLESMRAE